MSSLALAQRAKLHWPQIIGEPHLIMHRENAVFRVGTTGGAAALRIHRPGYHSAAEIESELQWMAHLAQHGLKLPQPITNRSGALISTISDDDGLAHVVDLLSWVDGTPLGRSNVPLAYDAAHLQRIFKSVGQTLAQLHATSDAWSPPPTFIRHHLDADGFLGEKAAWGKFWDASVLSASEKDLMQSVRQEAGMRLETLRLSGADYGLIHADLVRENIFVRGNEVSFIDFDDAGFGYRMFDLAVALVKNRTEPHYETIKSSLFEGYQSRRKISNQDRSSLNMFLALRDFAYLGWADARRHEASMASRIETIRRDCVEAAERFLGRG